VPHQKLETGPDSVDFRGLLNVNTYFKFSTRTSRFDSQFSFSGCNCVGNDLSSELKDKRSTGTNLAIVWVLSISNFKHPPPVGFGGGYMFSGRPSVPLSVRASVRPSVIHVVVLCFRNISSIC